jgi:outer membrane protein OmpA-like peptidoglycan-associated protein
MPDPVSSANTVRAYPIIGRGETFDVSPTQAEHQQIVAARSGRAKQGHGFGRTDNGRHRLVGFDYNKAQLKPAHMRYIRSAVLKEAKSFRGRPRIWVRGYASRSGNAQGNLGLSMRRAKAVAAYLKKLVPNARVDVQAAGESVPYHKGTANGTESFMDRAVEIGVAGADRNTAVGMDPRNLGVLQQQTMQETFGRFASEARIVALLKAIDFPNLQSLLQSLSGRNKTTIKKNVLQHILNKSWPIIHKKYPDLSGQQVIDALRSWHRGLKQGG